MTIVGNAARPRLGGLARTSLREQALAALRSALTSGEIAPGTHLVETELSEALNISRGTLREALRQLQQEGLVEVGDRGRLMVRSLAPRDIAQIYQVRSGLEGLAMELLCRLPDRTAVVAELTRAVDAMGQASGELGDLVETDLDFHRRMCELTGNATLVQSWEMIAGSIRMTIMVAGPERAVSNMSVRRHQDIVDAVAAGDPEAARRILVDHMQGAVDNVIDNSVDLRLPIP